MWNSGILIYVEECTTAFSSSCPQVVNEVMFAEYILSGKLKQN